MKKSIPLLFLAVFLVQCSKDKDDVHEQLQDFTLTLNYEAGHEIGDTEHVQARAFLSDQSGNIVNEAEINVGPPTVLNAQIDPSEILDLTIVYEVLASGDVKFIDLLTYKDVVQETYNLEKRVHDFTNDGFYLNMTNTGSSCDWENIPPGAFECGTENGGYLNYRSNLPVSPISDYFISFKRLGDSVFKYFWQEDVQEGSVFNVDYSTLPEISNLESITLPDNDGGSFILNGFLDTSLHDITQQISYQFSNTSIGTLTVPVPLNLFDMYKIRMRYSLGDYSYTKTENRVDIPSSLEAPSFDFAVVNPNLDQFSMTTTGVADWYLASTFYSSNANGLHSTHLIYGEAAPEITFSIENLRLNIQSFFPNLALVPSYPLDAISLFNYSSINAYEDILRYKIERKSYVPSSVNEYSEGVTRDY
ncbi:hypothetical protein [Ulvibacter antarcticus]|uniref:Uncharacterized protein n=1 Tax=Ulvibacter antarcticus TaxID=442714 RepID=A0A3L9YX00_9FLAO|nr:hypothetical protein [Ulvibacter antarcticus]RMA64864.1 hypothetical protein BXY75_1749 [Ulvibacter antarcticus]